MTSQFYSTRNDLFCNESLASLEYHQSTKHFLERNGNDSLLKFYNFCKKCINSKFIFLNRTKSEMLMDFIYWCFNVHRETLTVKHLTEAKHGEENPTNIVSFYSFAISVLQWNWWCPFDLNMLHLYDWSANRDYRIHLHIYFTLLRCPIGIYRWLE